MIDRYLLILLTLMLAGTVGAFFLLAPILPTLVVSLFLIGLLAMFWIGLHVAKTPVESLNDDSEAGEEEWNVSEHAG